MKNLLLFAAFYLLSSANLSAQSLTGTYTVDTALPASWQTNHNFKTITQAIDTLNHYGFTGAVTIELLAGKVYDEVLPRIAASGTGSIKFSKKGAGALPIVKRSDPGGIFTSVIGGYGDAVFNVYATSFITFDSLHIIADNPGIEYGIFLTKDSAQHRGAYKNITISNSKFEAIAANGKYSAAIFASNHGKDTIANSSSGLTYNLNFGNFSNIHVSNNQLMGWNYGIFFKGFAGFNNVLGDKAIMVVNNKIHDFGKPDAESSAAIYIENVGGADVSGNSVENPSGGSATQGKNVVLIDIVNYYEGNLSIIFNRLSDVTAAGQGSSLHGIRLRNQLSAQTTLIEMNSLLNLGSGGNTIGLSIDQNSSAPITISKNRIAALSSSSSTAVDTVMGVAVYRAGSLTISNNLIGSLSATALNNPFGMAGIYLNPSNATAQLNVYYNSVYLEATTQASNFGSAALFSKSNASTTNAKLDLRNNILVNKSRRRGLGYTVAFQRSGSQLANYAESSNNNIYFAGAPSKTNLIFFDGTNLLDRFAAFRNFVGQQSTVPGGSGMSRRDVYSQTEDPPFISVMATSNDFLHIKPGVASFISGGGVAIAGITTDVDNQPRLSPPDIGADEYNGTPKSGDMTVTDFTGGSYASLPPNILSDTIAIQLARRILGKGITLVNCTSGLPMNQDKPRFQGSPISAGFFENGIGAVDMESGIVLTSGRAKTIPGSAGVNGPNTLAPSTNFGGLGDPMLDTYLNLLPNGSGKTTKDATILEFSFVPEGDLLEFNYVFTSEEYQAWTCSNFTDVFAFLLISGKAPGTNAPDPDVPADPVDQNIAKVPGANNIPVAINSVNRGTINNSFCPTGFVFPQYYIDNTGSTALPPTSMSLTHKGKTVVLKAYYKGLKPCYKYRIKIAIADVSDGSLDSGVFLEANSFSSNEFSFISEDGFRMDSVHTTAVEGCKDAKVKVRLGSVALDTTILKLTYSGTATKNVDYRTIGNQPMPDSLIYLPGEIEKSIVLIPQVDGIAEGTETVVIKPKFSECRNTIKTTACLAVVPAPTYDSITVYIKDTIRFHHRFDAVSCTLPTTITATIDSLTQAFSYNSDYVWNTTPPQTTQSILVDTGMYVVTNHFRMPTASYEGCYNIDTFVVKDGKPKPEFSIDKKQMCVGDSVKLQSNYTNTDYWYWDFGDGRKDTMLNNNSFYKTFPTSGKFVIRHKIDSKLSCESATFTDTLIVLAKPSIGFTYSRGCLPPTGVVQFTDTSSVPDGAHQAINSWSWNFGDGNATASNPNTSTAKNPSHIYQYGNYTLHLKVTTDKGCSSDSTWTDNFKVTPVVALAALSAVCENVPPYSIASRASVTNGVPGTGKFEGNGVDAAGMFDPKIAGVGTHTISYIFESTGGCTDTAKQNIIVHPVPKADFSFVSSCVNSDGKVQFTDKSTISGGGTLMTNWDFGDGSPAVVTKNPLHAYTAEGSYPVKLTVGGAYNCMHDTTITAVVSIKPAISFGSVGDACISANTTVDLNTLVSITNGIAGSGVFSGPGVSGHTFNSAVAGEGTHAIKYVFTTTGGCKDSVTKNIAVKARPHPSFTYPSGCLNSDGKMSFTNTSTIGATETIASYSWDFGDGTPAVTTKDPIHTFSAEGTYQVKLTAKSAFGCSHDTTVAVVVKIGPAVSFSPLTAVCGNASAVDVSSKVVPVSGAAGTGVFSGAGISGTNFDPAVAGVGTHLLKYEYTTAGGCVASATQNIVVNAVPRPTFDFPSGCLSDNGEVQFTNTTKVSSGATVQSWSWDFGDVNATPTNPNTSTVKNPSHKYLEGSYTIQLKATYTSGCSGDTTATVSFTTLPKLGTVPAVAPVCENSTTAITLPAPPVLNAVPMGSQSFSGKGITDAATGLFDATLAGAGTHIIKYTYTSPSGCAASVNFSVQVYPKPAASFTVNKASLCLNDQLLFTDNSTVGAGNTIAKWEWNFGDGTPLRVDHTAPGNFTYAYPGEGSYTAVLKATSDKGCEGTSAPRIIKMNPLPKITNMQLPAVVCMPEGKASFSADATVSDGSTLKYLWNFGDGQSSSQRQPTITYSSAPGAGGYSIALQVKTAAGCIDTMRKQLTDFSNQPVAKFTTATDLCQGTESLFTNQSTAGGAPLKDYLWNFGDGRTSGDKNPNKVYIAAGSYNVSLQVRDDKGCMAAAPYTMAVKVHLQPKVDAGPTVVLKPGEYGQFKPKVNDSVNVNLMWSVQSGKPSGIVDPTKLSAWVKAIAEDTRYYLTGVGSYNCTAVDSVLVKVLQTVKIPNAFSPNGDGINDKWVIEGLADYPGHSIEVFSRQGKIVYSSQNYQQPWDGTFNGKALPAGTYYYVIDPKNGLPVMTGWIYMSK